MKRGWQKQNIARFIFFILFVVLVLWGIMRSATGSSFEFNIWLLLLFINLGIGTYGLIKKKTTKKVIWIILVVLFVLGMLGRLIMPLFT